MSAIERIIAPRTRDLGGFTVGRILPYARRRMVGPFIFFDVMGPAAFKPGTGIDVRPHPHIGLATVTYLFDGAFRHKDSLGFDQVIRPGDVNWMTAGRGIVHSERTDAKERTAGQTVFGVQSWVALPNDAEDVAPSFQHCPKQTLPAFTEQNCQMRLIAGAAFGRTSPVKTFSPIFYVDVEAEKDAEIPLPDEYEDRAVFVADGALSLEGETYESGKFIVVKSAATPKISAMKPTRVMLLGGAPLGERLIWWNLVASSQERIDQAKADWAASAAKGFDHTPFTLPPGESEHIPLPEG